MSNVEQACFKSFLYIMLQSAEDARRGYMPRVTTAVVTTALLAPILALAQTMATSLLGRHSALAMPPGPQAFCDHYPDSPHCRVGLPSCALCHTQTPMRNNFGADVGDALRETLPNASQPLTELQYEAALPAALDTIDARDSDGDGFANIAEITAGTWPGDCDSYPIEASGPQPYDRRYVFKKISLDVCGHSPSYQQFQDFDELPPMGQMEELHKRLDQCLDSEFWQGPDGVLWQLAHPKVRPVASLRYAGSDNGLPPTDYHDDYHLFVYSQIDDHDARDVLQANYFVTRQESPTRYARVDEVPTQIMQRERRAGLLTTQWVMLYNVMFAPLPRTAAAQAYRAFLGFDLARQEGLYPIPGEPMDYDDQGVDDAECAQCHSTLDPLSYPFKNYNGFHEPVFQYQADRIETHFAQEAANITAMPEAGAILGQPVGDLIEWAHVAANSDEFAAATVREYWNLLVGQPPSPNSDEFERLWRTLAQEHNYSVERMLHDLIETEAYGAL